MFDNHRQIVDLVERRLDDTPFCPCGRNTTATWRDGLVWLECASLLESRDGWVARLLGTVTAPAHLRQAIVEAPAPEPALAPREAPSSI